MGDRPARLGLITGGLRRVVPGVTIALGAWCASSPWWTRRPRATDTVVQALAPWGALAGFPAAALAAAERRRTTAIAGLVLGGSALALGRWVRGAADGAGGERSVPADPIRIGHFNVWYDNQRPGAAGATLAALDLDVLVLSELTPALAERFATAGLTDRYPHRIDRPRPRANGIAVWSRRPLREVPHRAISHERIRAVLDHPSGPVLIDALHVQSPIHHARMWNADFTVLTEDGVADDAAVMVGDFNAAWTHRRFRQLVERGWRDVHRELGLGLRPSWRIDKRPLPPFVRIDHALVNDGLDALAIDDVDLPGSDHRGFVVTVRRR